MAGIDPGTLTRKVVIERAMTTRDGHGGFTSSWVPLATVRAEVRSQAGREAVLARSLQGISSYRITIRWRRERPTTADRIIYDGQELNIRTCDDPDGSRDRLVIFADTESPEGP